MLHGLLFLLLVLLPLASRAQTAPASAAMPDSATAIRQLFWQRRQGADFGLAVGCGPLAPGTGSTAAATSQLMVPPGAVAGLGTNCSVLTFVDRMRFSVRREQEALQCLAQHQPLPRYVQRALGPILASK